MEGKETTDSLKRKRESSPIEERKEFKKHKPTIVVPCAPSSSGVSKKSDSTSGSSSNAETDFEILVDPFQQDTPEDFRYSLVSHSSNPVAIQNKFIQQWGKETIPFTCDIVDRREKLLVVITNEAEKSQQICNRNHSRFPHTGYIVIDGGTIETTFVGIEEPPVGLKKATSFLLKRKMIRDSMGIIDTVIQEKRDLIKEVMVNKEFNKNLTKWVQSWNKESFETYSFEELNPPNYPWRRDYQQSIKIHIGVQIGNIFFKINKSLL